MVGLRGLDPPYVINMRRAIAVLGCLFAASSTFAGGGPENVAIVVNAKSEASLTIANHYAQLRHVPAVNIVRIDWEGPLNVIPVEDFRTKILQPAITTLARASWNFYGPLSLELDAGARLPLQRTRFFFQPDTTIYRTPAVGLTLGGGLGVRIL